jgi:hypothetical protein
MVDDDEAIGVGVAEWPEEHRLDDGKDGDVRADAEGKRQHGGGGERGLAQETAERVAEIVRRRERSLGRMIADCGLRTHGLGMLRVRNPQSAIIL